MIYLLPHGCIILDETTKQVADIPLNFVHFRLSKMGIPKIKTAITCIRLVRLPTRAEKIQHSQPASIDHGVRTDLGQYIVLVMLKVS